MTTAPTIETVSGINAVGKHSFESVATFLTEHSQFERRIATIEGMYGTNVLEAPLNAQREQGAPVVSIDPSFRIRHSRPSAGYEVPRAPLRDRPTPPRVRRSRLRLTPRGRAVFATLAALPLVIAMFVFTLNGGGANATVELANGDFEYVTVMAGQTLWQLAAELDPAADPRDVIYDVLQLNQLTSSQVQAGQRLAIPTAYASAP